MSVSASALALTLLVNAPRSAPAAGAAPCPTQATDELQLIIDTSDLDDELGSAQRVRAELELRARESQAQRWTVARVGAGAWVELRVTMANREDLVYVIDIDLVVDRLRTHVVVGQRCTTCTEAQLTELAIDLLDAAELPELLTRLRLAERLARLRRLAPGPAQPDPGPSLGALGLVGAVAIGAGAASLLAGGLLLSASRDLDADEREPWRLGVGFLIAGGAATVIGGAGLVADRVRWRRRQRAVAFALAPGLDGASLIVRGKF